MHASAEDFEFDVVEWVNSTPLTPADLRGKVVLVEFFQMLCPGCVRHSIPQAQKVHRTVRGEQIAVLGIHSVFEHHEAMTPAALKVYLSEFGVDFPVAVDRPREGLPVPATMRRWELAGTPTTMLVDRRGKVRQRWFGQLDDLVLGVWLGTLLQEED